MSMELEKYEPTNESLAVFIESENVLARFKASLGGIMPVEQFIANMLTAFREPAITVCTDRSKHKVMHECAAMGVLPTLDQVALIPREIRVNGRGTGKFEVHTMVEWRGYKAVMERHAEVWTVTAYLIHKIDEYSFANGIPSHKYDPLDPKREFKNVQDIRGGYCRILYRNGLPPSYHMVSANQIKKCQDCAQTQKMWNPWYEQMALKTVYRDTFARAAVPIDPIVGNQMREQMRRDDIYLGNDPNRLPDERPHVPQLTTADIMGTPTPEPVAPPFEDGETPQTPPAAETKTPAAAESELVTDIINNINLSDNEARLDQWVKIVDSNEKLSTLDKEIVYKEIKKCRAHLTRGERSNREVKHEN